MTKEIILESLCLRFELDKKEVSFSVNLFSGIIDSLDFLEYATLVGEIAQKNNKPFDIKDFLYSECYSIDDIYNYLNKTG